MNVGLQRIGIDLKNHTENEGQLFFIILVFFFFFFPISSHRSGLQIGIYDPINDSSGVLSINQYGNLVHHDSSNCLL